MSETWTLHGFNSSAMTSEGEAQAAFPTDLARTIDSTGGFATNQGGTLVSGTFVKTHRATSTVDAEIWQAEDTAPTLSPFDLGNEHRSQALVTEPAGFQAWRGQNSDLALTPDGTPPLTNGRVGVLTSSTEDGPARATPWPASGAVYPTSAAVCGMRSDVCCESCGHDGSSGRMFPDYLASIMASTGSGYSWTWMTSGTVSRGELSMHVGSESPNVVVACSLSRVLETQPVPPKYWLSAKAAAGILRRAQARGKDLPPQLKAALESLAQSAPTTASKTKQRGQTASSPPV